MGADAYGAVPEPLPYARVELDPRTQTGVWIDADGLPVPAAERHRKTYTGGETGTQTMSHDGVPNSSDSDSDQGTSDSD